MPFRRVIVAAVVAVALMLLAGFAWTWRPAIAPIAAAERPSVDEPTFRHGAELAAIGNCNDCHTVRGGQSFAGGALGVCARMLINLRTGVKRMKAMRKYRIEDLFMKLAP